MRKCVRVKMCVHESVSETASDSMCVRSVCECMSVCV